MLKLKSSSCGREQGFSAHFFNFVLIYFVIVYVSRSIWWLLLFRYNILVGFIFWMLFHRTRGYLDNRRRIDVDSLKADETLV